MKRLYRILLKAYPRSFREAYEEDLCGFFEDQCRDPRYQHRVFGAAKLWWHVLPDLFRNAARLRYRSQPKPKRSKPKGEFTMVRDLRYAMRRLLQAPGFTIAAVLTLALGIGASSAIFSVVHAVVIRPLPYPASDRLVSIWHAAPGAGVPRLGFSLGSYLHYQELNRTFEVMAAYELAARNLTGDGEPQRTEIAYVTASFFDLFQPPLFGRIIEEEDDRPGATDVVVMSHRLWQQRYGSDPSVLDRSLLLDGEAYRVVGIMPPRFDAPTPEIDLWLARKLDPERVTLGGFSPVGLGRMKPGVTADKAQSDLVSLVPRLEQRFPGRPFEVIVGQAEMSPRVTLLKEEVVGDVERMRWILLGTVGLVLLVAGANVANLFIVRAEARRREVAIHSALGAGRSRLVRHFLTESMLLSLFGGALGLVTAQLAMEALTKLGPGQIPRLHEVGMNATVLGFALISAILVGFAFGMLTVARFKASSLPLSLKEGMGGTNMGRERHRCVLAIVQVALALVLLVCAGLMVRSFIHLRNLDPGFDEKGALSFRLSLPELDYPDRESTAQFHQRLLDRLAGLEGMEVAGAITCLPLTGCRSLDHVQREGAARAPDELPPPAHTRGVTPGYFQAMHIPIVEGRYLERRDHEDRTGAVVVSRTLAERWWPGESAIGKGIYAGAMASTPWYRIVGVVGDVPTNSLIHPREEIVYFPMIGRDDSIHSPRSMVFVLRVEGYPEDWIPIVRREVAGLDPNLAIASVLPLDRLLADVRAPTAFATVLLGIAAFVALFLGGIGVYGVQSYMVSQRTGEIGLRMALGASAANVSRMILKRGATVALIGVAMGWLAALGITRWMESLLYGVPAADVWTYVAVSGVLVLVAIAASYLPARRAARQDPSQALRSQ